MFQRLKNLIASLLFASLSPPPPPPTTAMPPDAGTTHGVFVLDEASVAAANVTLASEDATQACTAAHCRRFLHKPSEAVMHAAGAPLGDKQDIVSGAGLIGATAPAS